MEIRPIDLHVARRFVGENHRHNMPPKRWRFGTGLFDGEELVGVAIAGRPISHHQDDKRTIEILRVCTIGTPNACSMLYGALCRAAKALGYRRALTYTTLDEPGTSLRAAGFELDGQTEGGTWDRSGRHRYQEDLFGSRHDDAPKNRWIRRLAA
jgi:hypothetical protein